MKKTSLSSRLFALLLALVTVLSLLPTAVFAADEEASAQTYTKVTSAPEDWAGTYLIVNEENKAAFDGSLEKLDAVNDYKKVEISIDNTISVADKIAFTIKKMEDGYSIKAANGKYI